MVTPKYGAIWTALPDLELFANVAQGLHSPVRYQPSHPFSAYLSYGRILRTRLDNPAPGAGVLLSVPAHTWLPGCRDAGKRESGLLIAPVVLE
ncbi:hypothetical protein INH39_16365 [Massilia violaceinigra]|uniref:Uncharacterized protein n=1 Tax=Massilia violaceinigra TaxID=2045208 RepID=A0ABY4AKD0_9BURK|nr:TonB-dependent receptor [Massilia violaceinigra]UOD33068.1 hypothetical protein INH39_16365 [Massilia violaceinigra]